MNVQYQQLCKIAFKHSYYADGKLKEFSLNPTSEAQSKMKRNILHRQIGNEVIFAANQAQPINTTNLHFSLNLQNPYFLAFTAIGLEKKNNTKVVEVSGEAKYLFTSTHAIDGVIPMEECKLVSTIFEVKFKTTNELPKQLQLVDASGNLAYEAEITQEETHLVDVSENISSSGIYKLIFDGQQIEQLFITSAVQEYQGMGILEIDPSRRTDYFIQLWSRQVYFEYNLILMDKQKNASFNIKANDGQAVAYQQQEEKILPNGQASTPIFLQEKIALAERPTRAFSLEMETAGNIVSIPLPFADSNNLKRLESDNQSEDYISEMYIYL